MLNVIRSISTFFMITLITASTVPAADYRFELLDLSELNDFYGSYVSAINNDGVVTGSSYDETDATMATTWIDGRGVALGMLPGDKVSDGYATNRSGQSVGHSSWVEFQFGRWYTYPSAVLFENGQVTDLESLVQSGQNWELKQVYDINETGQIVGYAVEYGSEDPYGFVFHDGILTDLGSLGGVNGTFPWEINNAGQVIGQSWTETGEIHSFLWESGGMVDLGTLGGPVSNAHGINEIGQIVGVSQDAAGAEHAVLWTGGETIDLGGSGGDQNIAYGINDQGQVVGYTTDEFYNGRIFLWEDGVMVNPLDYVDETGWDVTSTGIDINDAGQILGQAYRDNMDHNIVLTPVDLEIFAVIPGRAGEVNYVDIIGLTPGEEVHLEYGPLAGMTRLSDCDGATVLISQPRNAGTAIADETGGARIEMYVPPAGAGHTFRVQAVQLSECLVSNVETVTFN